LTNDRLLLHLKERALNKLALMVLGMHRSGTSATSGMLSLCGFDLGRSVMGGNWANPKGFYENLLITDFNEDLLHYLHVNWHNTLGLHGEWWKLEQIDLYKGKLWKIIQKDFPDSDLLLFKDPRLCVLLPLYITVLKELNINFSFILTSRHPVDIAKSLLERDSFIETKSYNLWMDYMLKAENYSRGHSRLVVNYDEILREPLRILSKINKIFSLNLTITNELNVQITNFIEPQLNHSRCENLPINSAASEIMHLFDLFQKLIESQVTQEIEKEFDWSFNKFYSFYTRQRFPKITILTKVNENTENLEKTILSVTTQDYPDLEFIIIKETSRDEINSVLAKNAYLISQIIDMTCSGIESVQELQKKSSHGDWIGILENNDTFLNSQALSVFINFHSLKEEMVRADEITDHNNFSLLKYDYFINM